MNTVLIYQFIIFFFKYKVLVWIHEGTTSLNEHLLLLLIFPLYRYTDCNILTHNDLILERLQKKMETVSFNQMNENIAAALCGVTLPTDTLTTKW